MTPSRTMRAFSLIEVTLAIGIVSFALLAVFSLLPAGMKTLKNASEEAGAANVLTGIDAALRGAAHASNSTYRTQFSGQTIQYTVGAPPPPRVAWSTLTLAGTPETANSPKRLTAVLDILESPSPASVGRAVASVAWSAQSKPVWNATTREWSNAEGSLTRGIQFLPR